MQTIPARNTIDKLIHEPARLQIMTLLLALDSAEFGYIQETAQLTQGNLSSHIAKLAKAEYVAIEKRFVANRPQTRLRLTDEGRMALQTYRTVMLAQLNRIPE